MMYVSWILSLSFGCVFGMLLARFRDARQKKASIAAERRRLAVLLVEQFRFVERTKVDVAQRGFTRDLLVAYDSVTFSPFEDIRTEMRRVLISALFEKQSDLHTIEVSLNGVVWRRSDTTTDAWELARSVQALLDRVCPDVDDRARRDRIVASVVAKMIDDLSRCAQHTLSLSDEALGAFHALRQLQIAHEAREEIGRLLVKVHEAQDRAAQVTAVASARAEEILANDSR